MNAVVTASTQASNELVQVVDGTPKVSHIRIAENTWNESRAIKYLIEKYQHRIEKFGVMTFEMSKPNEGGWRPWKEYYLNENQATFLMTLLRNSEVVVDFKENLLHAFVKLKDRYYKKIDETDPKALLTESLACAVRAGSIYEGKIKQLSQFERMIEWIVENKMKRI